MEKVYILGGLRTPIGITNGSLKECLTEDLASVLIKEIVEKFYLKDIDSVILGNVVGPGGNIARLSSLKAGIDVSAFTIDMQCASALKSIEIAYSQIACGLSDIVIAGGVESTSMAPLRYYSKNYPKKNIENEFFYVSKFIPDEYGEFTMIEGAERVARKHRFTREYLDDLSIKSQRKAVEAKKNLENIKVPIIKIDKENNNYTLNDILVNDDKIEKNINKKLLKRIKPILKNGEFITAGNASLTNDGAAVILLCSKNGINKIKQSIKRNNDILKNIFEIKGFENISGDGRLSPEMSIKVVKSILEKFMLKYDDIDFFEVNESFAVITALFEEEFKSSEKLNVFGGALAYGHPYGASGGIITIHLMEALKLKKGKRGIVAIPSAGGLGCAMLIELIEME